jgi:hypothetical protein
MNAHVLNNLLVGFHHNEHKEITKVRKHTNLNWDRFQVVLRDTLKVLKPAFVKLASSHIFQLLGMIAWGVGFIIFNLQTKVG